jgi:hypothetical protein
MNPCEFCASNTKMCLISDKLYRFCCQEARSRPPVTVLNLPPCINESDSEDEDNNQSEESDSESDTESVESDTESDV